MKKCFLSGIFLVLCLGGFWAAYATAEESVPARKDIEPEWYFPEWLSTSPHTPVFKVLDTVNKYGRYAKETKTITLKDLIKFHGHFCGGLVESAAALRVAFDFLFPTGSSIGPICGLYPTIPLAAEMWPLILPEPG